MTSYPVWPPHQLVDLVHWYGNRYDPLLMARPAFFKATIWIDSVAFGPFYAAAIYAFIRGREWIRTPAMIWAGIMMANVFMILSEEAYGIHATTHLPFVISVNAPWFLLPIAVILRLRRPHPFSADSLAEPAVSEAPDSVAADSGSPAPEPADAMPAALDPAASEPADPGPAVPQPSDPVPPTVTRRRGASRPAVPSPRTGAADDADQSA